MSPTARRSSRRAPSPTLGLSSSPPRSHPSQVQGPERSTGTVARASTEAVDGVMLFCGLEHDSDPVLTSSQCPRPAPQAPFLPCPSPPPSEPPRKRQKRSNGCGTRVHAAGREATHWRAPLAGVTTNVIPLERSYFTSDAVTALNLHEDACGCAVRGVGCKICGNALGALDTPCARHAEGRRDVLRYTFLPFAVSPPLPVRLPRVALVDLTFASSPAFPRHPRPRGTRRRVAPPPPPPRVPVRSTSTAAWDSEWLDAQLESPQSAAPEPPARETMRGGWEWFDVQFAGEQLPTTPSALGGDL
ncbi:hypothetical protein C8F04DRAFT_1268799 [Mycena alexandri]|uniref:Uncharacterized protein n=1 Tax=Mycena alexandri TaxID=1745969 RepID=A0AAD6SHX1_9AGAR|nr:hypothetical protein C8F04DRAFT_1268799 [Mycena alexandri]